MVPVPMNDIDRWEVCVVQGKPFMFTSLRVDRTTVPKGMYAYDVRGDDETTGGFAQVQSHVLVNHWGTIIGIDPIVPNFDDSYLCDEEDDGAFLGGYVTDAVQFVQRYDEFENAV